MWWYELLPCAACSVCAAPCFVARSRRSIKCFRLTWCVFLRVVICLYVVHRMRERCDRITNASTYIRVCNFPHSHTYWGFCSQAIAQTERLMAHCVVHPHFLCWGISAEWRAIQHVYLYRFQNAGMCRNVAYLTNLYLMLRSYLSPRLVYFIVFNDIQLVVHISICM